MRRPRWGDDEDRGEVRRPNASLPNPGACRASSRSARFRCGLSYIWPSMPTTPGFPAAAKAATTAFACSTASADGVKASLITGTCAGWIAIFAVKPSRSASRHSARNAVDVAKIHEDRVDRRDLGRGCGKDRHGAREAEDVGVAAAFVPRGASADRGGKVLGAPGQPGEARACAAVARARKHAGCPSR